jgi:hypothetical protein
VADEGWRTEADDAWLATHRSGWFNRFRRLGGVGDAVSQADLGILGGAPRQPPLNLGGRSYAVIRRAEHQYAHTRVLILHRRCRQCGRQLVEVHRVVLVNADGTRRRVGEVRMCRRCQADSWLFFSRMPAVCRAREMARKVVL